MKIETVVQNGKTAAVVRSDEILISSAQSALDFLMTVRYESGCDAVALNREAVCGEFFILSTGLAGEILQKFVNYRMRFAVYGDFSQYTSKPLRDFIRESNRGSQIFFAPDRDEAVRMLMEAE